MESHQHNGNCDCGHCHDQVSEKHESQSARLGRWRGPLLRFFGFWAAFSGIYAAGAVCPFCGQATCVGAVAAAPVAGAICAGVASAVHHWRSLTSYFRTMARRPRQS